MAFSNKTIHDLQETDIEDLINSQETEGKNVEYKAALSLSTEDGKKEFLADISSFANTSGGFILFGVEEEKGIPTKAIGIEVENFDAEKLRIDNIIRDGISPRVPGVAMQPVLLKNGRFVFAIFIPKSLASPHMVTYKGSSRFFARNSAGKYILDVQELRQAFLLSETVSEKIRNFRLDRVAQIAADETPVSLFGKERVVAHIIPFSSFSTYQFLNMKEIATDAYKLLGRNIDNGRHNIDGYVASRFRSNEKTGKYFQIFRSGQIEYVESDLSSPMDDFLTLPSRILERNLILACVDALKLLQNNKVECPSFIFVSLIGVKNVVLPGERAYDFSRFRFDRDIILCREIMLEEYPTDGSQLASILKPILDEIWNAAGHPESPNKY